MKLRGFAAFGVISAVFLTVTGCVSEGGVNTDTEGNDAVTQEAPLITNAVTEAETTEPETTEPETTAPAIKEELVIWKKGEKRCNFVISYDKNAEEPLTAEADMFAAMIQSYTGAGIKTADASKSNKKEIVLSSSKRKETADMMKELSLGEYAVRAEKGDGEGEGRLYIAITTYNSAYSCAEYLLENHYDAENGFSVPADLEYKGVENNYRLIESTIKKKLRDPFVLLEDGVYYAYGTGWKLFKNESGKLSGSWKKTDIEVTLAHPDTDGGSHWAPEVHKYNGAYYMFTTYYNSKTSHRGCIILRADNPEGPFAEITDGHITPASWDCIDGTFYVDPDGQPWMVFVHEWTSMKDGVGSFAAAKLSDDLTHFISEPIELFKANEPKWAKSGVTDGCFMYTTKDGELLMIWSNFDAFGYSVAVARSSDGRLDGEWTHENELLYSKCLTNKDDGGHGMIFTDTDGQMYLCFHSPNTEREDQKERPVFLAVEEKDGRIVRSTFNE